MSGLDGLNIFGKLTNKDNSKVSFQQADINNDGQVTQAEFKSIESLCKIDRFTFNGLDKNSDGVIRADEWNMIQTNMNFQTVLNNLKKEIARSLYGIDSVLTDELVEFLISQTESWTSNDMNTGDADAAGNFRDYITNEMQNWLTTNEARRPSVILETALNEVLNGDNGYINPNTQSNYHQQLLSSTINTFANNWIRNNYANYENATDAADALKQAVQNYMNEVVDMDNGTTRLDSIKQKAIQNSQNTAQTATTTCNNYVTYVTNSNPQEHIGEINSLIETAEGLDVSGNAEAQAKLNLIIEALRNALNIAQHVLEKMQEYAEKAREEKELAMNAATSKEAEEHAKNASEYQEKASALYNQYLEALNDVNQLRTIINAIKTGIDNPVDPNPVDPDTVNPNPEISETEEGSFTNAQLRSRNNAARTYVQNTLSEIKSELLAEGYSAAKIDEAIEFLTELYGYRISNASTAGEGLTISKTEMKTYILNYFRSDWYSQDDNDVHDLQILNESISESAQTGGRDVSFSKLSSAKEYASMLVTTNLDLIKAAFKDALSDSGLVSTICTNMANDYSSFISSAKTGMSSTTSVLSIEYKNSKYYVSCDFKEMVKRFKALYMTDSTSSTTFSNTSANRASVRQAGNGEQTDIDKLDDIVAEYNGTQTYTQGLTQNTSLITAVENNAKSHVNTLLDNIAASMRAKGLTENWISAALTTAKDHYRTILTNIGHSFIEDGITCNYHDYDPDRGGGPRGEILSIQIDSTGVANYYKTEYLKLDPSHS